MLSQLLFMTVVSFLQFLGVFSLYNPNKLTKVLFSNSTLNEFPDVFILNVIITIVKLADGVKCYKSLDLSFIIKSNGC